MVIGPLLARGSSWGRDGTVVAGSGSLHRRGGHSGLLEPGVCGYDGGWRGLAAGSCMAGNRHSA